jgi:hypothetical protein
LARYFFSHSCSYLSQNIAVRKYLEKRAKEKEIEQQETAEREKFNAAQLPKGAENLAPHLQSKLQQAAPAADDQSKKKKGWGRGRKEDKDEAPAEEVNEADLYHSPRPPFYAHTRPTRRTQVPRDVAVPYFRFRKDRFYDWPPDPTVSRATPLLAAPPQRDEPEDFDDEGSFAEQEQQPRGARRRRKPKEEEVDYGYG